MLAQLLAMASAGAGPAQNLWVELRWVDSSVSAQALGGVRDGAVVIGTGGSVSPRGGASISTQRAEDRAGQQVQRVLVLNGQQASLQLTETTPVQWVDFALQFDGSTAAAGAANAQNANSKGWALPRQGFAEQTRGFTVTPNWPGGQQPVRVELRAQGGAGATLQNQTQTQAQVISTVSVPLGQWLTVARSGTQAQAPQRGVISSRSAETQSSRELQLRVELAP